MTKKVSTLALMTCLASALTFAGAQTNSTQAADNTKTTQKTASANAQEDGHGNTNSAKDNDKKHKDKKKGQHEAKPAPSTQEQEFDRVLLGIYG